MNRDKLLGVRNLIEEVDMLQKCAEELASDDAESEDSQARFYTKLDYKRSGDDPVCYLDIPRHIVKSLLVERHEELVKNMLEAGFKPDEEMVMSKAAMSRLLGI